MLAEPTTKPTHPPASWTSAAVAASRDRTAVLVLGAATVTTGLLAGLYYGYACSVMPGLARADDRTLVDGMQQINEVIQNPVFFATFMGAPLLNAATWWIERRAGRRDAARWALIGLGLSTLGFLITAAFNIPLNNQLDRAGDPSRIADLAAVRHNFLVPWSIWNVLRAVATTGALGCLVAALHRRSERTTPAP
jgi:uncharacterized membrane protein